MVLVIVLIPAMSAAVERLFSHCKFMLTDRPNRLQIHGLEAAECIKSGMDLRLDYCRW